MKTLAPTAVLLSCLAVLIFAFVIPTSSSNQLAAVASSPTFTFKESSLSVTEGDRLKVTIVAPATLTATTRVKVTTKAGTAKSGTDFTPLTTYVTFYKGGLKEKSITLSTKSDAVQEQAEMLTLSLSVNNRVVNTARVTILDKGNTTTPPSVVGTADCTQRSPNVMGTPRTLVTKNFDYMWNIPFPGSPFAFKAEGQTVEGITYPSAPLQDGSVIAFAFVAPPVTTSQIINGRDLNRGYIQTAISPNLGGRASLIDGISECPGDLSDNKRLGCSVGVQGEITRLEWAVTPPQDFPRGSGRENTCFLTPGRTYYYNLSTDNRGCVSGPLDAPIRGATCAYRLESKGYYFTN